MNWSVRSLLTHTVLASGILSIAAVAFAAEDAALLSVNNDAEEILEASEELETIAAEAEAEDSASEPAQTTAAPPPIGPAPSFARSDEAANTRNGFHADMDLRFRVQPLGLVLSTRMYNEFEYMRGNISPFFSHVFLRAGAVVNLSPAYAEGGLDVEFQPIRLFHVRAQYIAGYHFGTFKYMLSYDNPNPITRDDELKEIADQARSGVHQRLEIAPTFQVALGKIALRNTFTYQRMWFPADDFQGSGENQGPWLRESSYDRMIHVDGDTVLTNLLLVMYSVWDPDGPADGQLLLGPFHEWTRGVKAQDNRHRVGLTALLIPKHNWGNVYRPRLILQAGYNVVDRENGRANRAFVQGSLGFTLHGRQ